MTQIDTFLAQLSGVRKSGNGWSARCPAHDDHSPSLSISEGDDGKVLLKCHAGCTTESVVAALGLKMSDLMQTNTIETPKKKAPATMRFQTPEQAIEFLERSLGKHSKAWEYFDNKGELVGMHVRWDFPNKDKTFRQISRQGNFWEMVGMATPSPLYLLPTLEKENLVFVVEGEKAADAICSIGLSGTTSVGGSNAPQKTDWSPLAGKKVMILPDNDEPGWKYAESVAKQLRQLSPPATVHEIQLPDLPDKGDIVDWIAQSQESKPKADLKAEILEMVREAEQTEPEAQEADWDAFQPFPVDALPEPIRSFVVEGSKAIGCDPSFFALPLLTALGTCIGNTRRIVVKPGWNAPPILWTCIVGESGSAKTPAFQTVMKALRDLQLKEFERQAELEQAYLRELAVHECRMTDWKKHPDDPMPEPPVAPDPVRYFVQDITIEALVPILKANPRGVLVARDELAGWFGSFDRYSKTGASGTDASCWLSMYNAETVSVDRKTGIPRTIYVKEAAVGITGGIQPAILQRAISGEHRENGMAARILLAAPPRVPKQWREDILSDEIKLQVHQIFEKLIEFVPGKDANNNPVPQLVRMQSAAKKIFIEFYDANAIQQLDFVGDLAAAWSKLEEVAPRIALILHCIKKVADTKGPPYGRSTIDAETMGEAIRLTEWFKNEIKRVFAVLDEDEEARDQRKLLDWIRRQSKPVTSREVQQYCRWLKEAGAAHEALVELVDKGLGTWLPTPKGKRGTPTKYFVLNKPSTDYAKGNKPADNVKSVDVDNEDKADEMLIDGELFPNEARLPD